MRPEMELLLEKADWRYKQGQCPWQRGRSALRPADRPDKSSP